MKYRMLIVSYSMGVGGVERALLGLLNSIDYSKIEVVLKLARKQGELLSSIPPQVVVEEIEPIRNNWDILTQPLLPIAVERMSKISTFHSGMRFMMDYLAYKVTGHYHHLFKGIFGQECDNRHYDVAISYAGPSSMLDYYVARHVIAKQKVAWIHFDVDKFGLNKKSEALLYYRYDKIFVVSEQGKSKFDEMFPSAASKSEVFHNIVDKNEVLRLGSSSQRLLPNDTINCVTVGRLSKEKGQDRVIRAIAILRGKGYNVHLTLVGGGNFQEDLRRLAHELGVDDIVDITGVCPNPYPYMAQCDIYVQPSVHEGFCITLAEAKIFGMPIVATDFTGAREQLACYPNGHVSAHDVTSIVDCMSTIISENNHVNGRVANLKTDNDIDKLIHLIK